RMPWACALEIYGDRASPLRPRLRVRCPVRLPSRWKARATPWDLGICEQHAGAGDLVFDDWANLRLDFQSAFNHLGSTFNLGGLRETDGVPPPQGRDARRRAGSLCSGTTALVGTPRGFRGAAGFPAGGVDPAAAPGRRGRADPGRPSNTPGAGRGKPATGGSPLLARPFVSHPRDRD